MKLTAVLIALNEEKRIAACLDSVQFCDEVVVVDSGSSDRTAEIARAARARVVPRRFDDFSSQKNFAVAQASNEWVFSIDADERATPELAEEIRKTIRHAPPAAGGYRVSRDNYIFGKKLRCAEGDEPVRLFRKEGTRFQGVVHEVPAVKGEVGLLTNPLIHHSTETIADYMRKLNSYTTLEAKLLKERGAKFRTSQLFVKPALRFGQKYFLNGGILDGKEGLIFCLLSGYYEMVRYLKFWEILKADSDRIKP